MCIYLKNIPVKFHPDPIQNYAALGILDQVKQWSPQEEDEEQDE